MAEVIGVLLAAGFSSRFGANKLLAKLNGQCLIAHSAAALAPCDHVIAVIRDHDRALQSALHKLDVECVVNPQPQRGMGFSIASAMTAINNTGGCCILPADMPWVMASTTQLLVHALHAGATLAAPYYQGKRGHPVAFSARFYGALGGLDGDSGARHILQQHAGQLCEIAVNDAGILRDVDKPVDLGGCAIKRPDDSRLRRSNS